MENKKQLWREVLLCAIWVLVGTGLMYGVFALLGKLSGKVLLGGLLGAALGIGNYALMALSVSKASDKAEEGDVKAGKAIMTGSMLGRYLLLLLSLVFIVKTGYFHPYAAIIPLLIAHASLYLSEIFRKAGERRQ